MKAKIGIYGGTFAPVHNGHIRCALEFKRRLGLERLLIIPTNIPPHKDKPTGDSNLHRLNMLRLVFDSEEFRNEGIEISTYELDREGKSYSVDTLGHYHNDDTELYFLIGTDMLLCMHQWFKVEEIAKLATLVYTRREADASLDAIIKEQVKMLENEYGFNIIELIMEPLEISSTEVRTSPDKQAYLPESVAKYIEENRLYVQ